MGVSTWLFIAALVLGCVLGVGALFETPSLGEPAGPDAPDGDDLPGGEGTSFWSTLGVGLVPLGMLVSLDLLLIGGVGVVASELLAVLLPIRLAAWVAVVVAFLGGPLLGARVGQSVARYVPTFETHGAKRRALVGRSGRTEIDVDARGGRARVRDAGGALHLIRCVARGPAIPAGVAILVIDLDAPTGVFEVERTDRLFAGEGALSRPSFPVT